MAKKRYTQFGHTLRDLRETAAETIHELSAALEADPSELEKIEQGQARPSEDMIMMLINHYAVTEEKATKLWELADYAPADEQDTEEPEHTVAKELPTIVVTMPDARVLYTDDVHILTDDKGVTLHFLQTVMPDTPKMIVSRMGMSKKQAAQLLKQLYAALKETPQPPKQLSSGD